MRKSPIATTDLERCLRVFAGPDQAGEVIQVAPQTFRSLVEEVLRHRQSARDREMARKREARARRKAER